MREHNRCDGSGPEAHLAKPHAKRIQDNMKHLSGDEIADKNEQRCCGEEHMICCSSAAERGDEFGAVEPGKHGNEQCQQKTEDQPPVRTETTCVFHATSGVSARGPDGGGTSRGG